jgi:hypothetical protein
MSIRPGMSVRPPPSITTLPAAGSSAIGALEMRSIRLPRTSTFDGADRDLPVPSKMRTFWNSVAPATVVCAAAAAPIEHSHADTAIHLMNVRIMSWFPWAACCGSSRP